MTGNSTAVVAAMSLFSYALMAAIAMATAGMIAVLVAGLAALQRRRDDAAAVSTAAAAPAVASTPARPQPVVPGAEGIEPAVVAAITAAVHVVASGHRVVWIGEAQPMAGWTSEVRQQHHGSHRPHP
jgi:hypothetical protein